MRLYLDEDTADSMMFKLLTTAGHDVVVPASEGLSGATDPLQLMHSIENQRAIVTHNHKDFRELHDFVRAAKGCHRGILVVRKDNDSTHDLSVRAVVNAIRKLELSGQAIENEYHTLNHWR